MSKPVRAPLRSHTPRVIDIRNLRARDLDPLLTEETADWAIELDWDFSKLADLVRKFADSGSLSGAALVDRGEVAGYGHTYLENRKGVIRDLYVRRGWRHGNAEALLCKVLRDTLILTPGVRRIESQLMFCGDGTVQALRREAGVRVYQRYLMRLDTDVIPPPGASPTAHRFRIDAWADHHLDAAATVVSAGHPGHIDSHINDQYRTFAGARRLLCDIVQFPGFHQPASYAAFDLAGGAAAGMLLSSFVAHQVAEITELCVAPNRRGAGLGYELLRRSIGMLRRAGAKRISLTVTSGNEEALRLYARCGFRMARHCYAYVWDTAGYDC